jgi:hypothetical protein
MTLRPPRPTGWVRLVLLLLLPGLPALAAAQDSLIVINPDAPAPDAETGGLPPAVITRLLNAWNDSGTIRLSGNLTLPAGTEISGRVASFRGTLRVAGTITGELTVINGDLVIADGGRVYGNVLVAGGRMTIDSGGVHEGDSEVHWDAAPVTRQSDGLLAVRERRRLGTIGPAEHTFQGRSGFSTTIRLTTNQTYNRIEGLGIVFGPEVTWRPSPGVEGSLDLRGVLRTAPDPTPFRRDLGWDLRNDWRFGDRKAAGVNLRAWSLVSGIEEHTLPRDEIGWNAFLFQRDNRDYYYNEGFGLTAHDWLGRRARIEASVRYEDQGSVRANDPWSLFINDAQWRPNPLIDDGHYLLVGLRADYDTRNSRTTPTAGWWLRGWVEWGSSDDVAPVTLPTTIRDPIPTDGYNYQRFLLDLRRYNRLSPDAALNLRLWFGGWLGGDPLPVQRRLSLGGLDMLPGYGFRHVNCAPAGYNDPAETALCDRAIVTQAEYRHRLNFRAGYTVREKEGGEFTRFIGLDDPALVLFGNAGSAWLSGDGPGRVPNNRIRSITEWKADLGIGIDAGGFGAYLAKSLTDGEPVRFFLRLERRF